MLVYIHVPFCRKRCHYCAFCSSTLSGERMKVYVEHLLQEIAFLGRKLKKPEVTTLFMGGGTPSLLEPADLHDIVMRLKRSFKLADNLEFSFEGNPDSIGDSEYLQTLKAVGVNRLSIGVQSLNDDFLQVLGRVHTSQQAVRAISKARLHGFSSINIDLIYGLPGQRLKLWLDDLKDAVALKPDHLSCYNLTIEPDTEMEKRCLSRAYELPSDDEQAKMFVYGAEYLESRGYLHYEISNFARMGFQCHHNLGYWEGQDYVGFGPSAVSTVEGRRWENSHDLLDWVENVRARTVGKDAEDLTLNTRVQEMVMLRLRTTRGLRLKAYKQLTGTDFVSDNQAMVNALHRNDLIRIQNGYVRLTKNGMLVSDTILANFFESFTSDAGREVS